VKAAPRDDPAAYARQLLKNADAVVLARSVRVSTDPYVSPGDTRISRADLEVLEHFKGPKQLGQIQTYVTLVTCRDEPFIEGEKRLFVLAAESKDNKRVFTEIHAWRLPAFSDTALTALLRAMARPRD
jgi:hypothetical protein